MEKPIIVAPAMNTHMWTHPFTQEHLDKLSRTYRLTVVAPIAKKLKCNDVGIGAIADTETIVAQCQAVLPPTPR